MEEGLCSAFAEDPLDRRAPGRLVLALLRLPHLRCATLLPSAFTRALYEGSRGFQNKVSVRYRGRAYALHLAARESPTLERWQLADPSGAGRMGLPVLLIKVAAAEAARPAAAGLPSAPPPGGGSVARLPALPPLRRPPPPPRPEEAPAEEPQQTFHSVASQPSGGAPLAPLRPLSEIFRRPPDLPPTSGAPGGPLASPVARPVHLPPQLPLRSASSASSSFRSTAPSGGL
jgi:hypothetical protein